MKQTFGSADIVGRCVVFDVGNNRFRLIARVFCESQKMYILKVMEFPLTSIRDDQHLAEARKVLNRLVMADLDKGSQDYLDALTDLVEKYEDKYVSIPDAPAQDVLRLLMESNKVSQNKLAKEVGIPQSTISEILAGTKQMNVSHMVKLSAVFGVEPAVFMPKGKR